MGKTKREYQNSYKRERNIFFHWCS